MLNFVKQSFILSYMEKYERKPRGIRFPVSLLAEIEMIMKSKKTDNFSALVVDLCWMGVKRYCTEEKISNNRTDVEKENEAIDE